MEQISRREFFSRRVFGQIWQKTAEILPLPPLPAAAPKAVLPADNREERTVMPEYFTSPLYSYALLSEMPWDMLTEEAKRLGIAFEGRSKLDIVRDIFLGSASGEAESP